MAKEWAKSFYNSSAWIKCSRAYMQSKGYVCERCGDPASVCHHKIYLTPENLNDPHITLNWENLECLCHTCHTLEHHSNGVIADGLAFDKNGDIIKVAPRE